jgi:hypothetical protein
MPTRVWRDLEYRGFVVMPGFLSPREVAVMLDGFDKGKPPGEYPFGFKIMGRAPLKAAWSKIEPALAEIREQTSLKVDEINFLTVSHYITTRLAERSSYLHQDFDLDYRLTRDHINYLNFWMPLRKAERARSNVTLIPFDSLRARSREEHAALVGSGGYRFVPRDGRTAVYGDKGYVLADGQPMAPERTLSFDLEDIAETPELDVGDLLLMRGDVIHRTQDAATERVSASVRATYSEKVINRERAGFDDGRAAAGTRKSGMEDLLKKCFDNAGRPELTIRELVALSRGAGGVA